MGTLCCELFPVTSPLLKNNNSLSAALFLLHFFALIADFPKFRDLIFHFSFLFLFVVVVSDITSTTICCSSGREIVVVLSQGFVVKRSISSSERKSSLRLRSHAQDEFSASWKFMRLGVLLTRNHLNGTKVLVAVQSFVWKEQNYWTIPCEWSVKFFSRRKIRPKVDCTWELAPPCTHTAHIRTNWRECRS